LSFIAFWVAMSENTLINYNFWGLFKTGITVHIVRLVHLRLTVGLNNSRVGRDFWYLCVHCMFELK